MTCPRCIGGFVMTTYIGTNYEDVFCVNCAWRYHPPNPFVAQLPLKDYGNCPSCSRESVRNSGYCARCFGARVRQGMKKMKYGVVV